MEACPQISALDGPEERAEGRSPRVPRSRRAPRTRVRSGRGWPVGAFVLAGTGSPSLQGRALSWDARIVKPRFPWRGAGASAPETGSQSAYPGQPTLSASREDRACCCAAAPLVRAIMPPTPERRSVDLLLCGHHYRVSRRALDAAGASIYDMPGKADAAAAALLDVRRDHVTAHVTAGPALRAVGRDMEATDDERRRAGE